ncbi:MAG: MBL fold metallo-hydrolase [Treponema sp.]|jgi:glyoxylase-like metal-dependent hydrolase (beta-lactamase superfamily II)|nr:MBL fold metallo-hydrolase [Treponema sp.]
MNNTGYYKVKEIFPWLFSIQDPQNVFCYLAAGKEKALLFDTVYGIGSLPLAIKEITDKPVYVVLGHGHLDHANGAYQFEEAWLHEADFELCRLHTSEEYRLTALKELKENGITVPNDFNSDEYIKAGTGNLRRLEPGRIFDLGGLHIEVVGMGGHTAGSIGILAQEHKILLTSDSATPQIWMFKIESLSVREYIAMLEQVVRLDFDAFITGHTDEIFPKSDFQKYINAARHLSVEKSVPFKFHPELKGLLYSEDGVEIVFSEAKLN